jgi:outer membrane murein-binding lipoprotein Lpp
MTISRDRAACLAVLLATCVVHGCSSDDNLGSSSGAGASSSGGSSSGTPPTNVDDGPPAGNPNGTSEVPSEAQAESITSPTAVVGDGSPASCTSEAFIAAVAGGGTITFDCGPAPTTITLGATAKVHNDKGPVVIDGGGKVTLSGGGKVRILYMNACDPENGGWASGVPGDCNEQVTPKLTVQNITFVDGSVKLGNVEEGGGAAMYIRGGRTKIVNARFFHNQCDEKGSDVAGGAVRVLDFPKNGSVERPVFVVNSTFGGKSGYGNTCANGGALASIGASWSIYNSLFTDNTATGTGASEGDGGNGGAIYNDGKTMAFDAYGASMENNRANEGGSAIFFVSNDETGTIAITDSTLRNNPKGKFETPGFPGMFVQAKSPPTVTRSTIE